MSRSMLSFVLFAVVGLIGLMRPAPARAEPNLQRFAVVAGANHGGPDRVRLKYAVSDARAFGDVLTELGGVDEADRRVLIEPDADELFGALDRTAQQVKAATAAGRRAEVVFYYSGHSDEQGLLLGGERVRYPDLKKGLDMLEADVRIAILDSCASGALTRAKGGQRVPPFVVDTSSDLEGHAYITSSAGDEASQESDRVGGSFFTHYLITGLRGGADKSRDGKITLGEAYAFAFHETVRRTEGTRIGTQHPAYDIALTGSGDLVLTDLRGTDSTLLLTADTEGHLSLRDKNGRLVAELRKVAGREIELSLPPGEYQLAAQLGDRRLSAAFTLVRGERTPLLKGDMVARDGEPGVARGPDGGAPAKVGAPVTPLPAVTQAPPAPGVVVEVRVGAAVQPEAAGVATDEPKTRWAPFKASFVPYLSTTMDNGLPEVNVLHLSAIAGMGHRLNGFEVAGVANVRTGGVNGVQIAGVVNIAQDVRGVQIGVVNVAKKVAGVQIGVVNISDDIQGLPIGLVNVVRQGQRALQVWGDARPTGRDGKTATDMYAGFKWGSRHLHTFILGGLRGAKLDERDTDSDGSEILSVGVGLGGHIPLGRSSFIDIDAISRKYDRADEVFTNDEDLRLHSQLRFSLGVRVLGGLAVIGGVSANHEYEDAINGPHEEHRIYAGAFLGLEI